MVKDHGGIGSHLNMVPTQMFTRQMLKQLQYLSHQDLHSHLSNRLMSLAGSGLKTEEEHLNINIVAALLI